MLRNTLLAALVATAMTAGFVPSSQAAAPAAGSPLPPVATQESTNIVPAAYVKVVKKRVHHHRFYGPRFRFRHGRYVHFYRGYWYGTPWWRHSVVAVHVGRHHSRRHVAWCFAHHPNYRPRANTWIGLHGRVHRCIAPGV